MELTQSMLMTLKFEVLMYPAYNPDLSSGDYEVFGSLKKFLEGKCFSISKTFNMKNRGLQVR